MLSVNERRHYGNPHVTGLAPVGNGRYSSSRLNIPHKSRSVRCGTGRMRVAIDEGDSPRKDRAKRKVLASPGMTALTTRRRRMTGGNACVDVREGRKRCLFKLKEFAIKSGR